MSRFVALLRGINVGKNKRLAMAELRALIERQGGSEVRTLLNSGNAVFSAAGARADALARRIAQAIADDLGLQVPVVVLSAKALDAAVAANPLPEATHDPARFLVAFAPSAAALRPASALARADWSPEAFAIHGQAAYLWCAHGIIESKLAKAFAKATADAATARNWATVLKLQALLAGGENAP